MFEEPKLPRKRHCSARYEEGIQATFAEFPRDSFRHIYFEAVGLIVHSIDLRDHSEELTFLEQLYFGDVDTLSFTAQVPLFRVLFGENEAISFDEILKRTTDLEPNNVFS